jgi:hypothetical protein
MRKEGANWSLEYEETILIARFEKGLDYDAFGKEAFPAFKQILDVHGDDIVGSANLVTIEDSLTGEVFEVWEAAADEYAELPNYKRGGFTAEGITGLSLKGKLDVPGAENRTFDDFETAIEWVRHGNN